VCHIEVHHHVLHSGKALHVTQIQDYIEKNSTNTLAYFAKEKESLFIVGTWQTRPSGQSVFFLHFFSGKQPFWNQCCKTFYARN